MIKHLFKIIWKRRKSNSLMMTEIFFSFLILFAVCSLGVYNFQNYLTPAGLETNNVWVAFINFNTSSDTAKMEYKELVSQQLKRYREVESFSYTSANAPFTFSTMSNSFAYNKKKASSDVITVEPDFPKAMSMNITQGRWFTKADIAGNFVPVVITKHLAKELFETEDAVGKVFGGGEESAGSKKMKVVGMVDYYKHKSDFQELDNTLFRPSEKWDDTMVLKVRAGSGAEEEAKIVRELARLGKDWTIEIQQMDEMKSNRNNLVLVPVLILLIICGFLVFNVALGMFGVLFQTINRRKQEIGVRRAMGATKGAILWHFIGETAVIATFGLILGLFFAVQFPLLNVFDVEASVYLFGMLLAVIGIYILVGICAFYPSRQASVLQPAVVLHEE
ncbi:putative ABC transport system permease protein [Runella defluvii]|uniref:Putative ABC transport system permease protein n=1 Tax=Runella defluvii TaxID=370973 RepID=A0A7W5ZK67_9BACT|nr:ABC transporter permease [Runella defluvii]MBB3838655.1 putative ABC transport system permease protein [Runella defluvii]